MAKEKPRGLLTNLPTREEGRYAARPAPRDWSPAEDLVLLPWLLAQDSERDYLTACRFLCRVLDRSPVYPGSARPTIETLTNDCVALIERRTVTGLLIGRPKWIEYAETFHTNARDGTPLSWAERNRFLKPYHRKIIANKQHVSYAELFIILDRDSDKDLSTVQIYLESRTHNPHAVEPENFAKITDWKMKDVGDSIRAFLTAAEPDAAMRAWIEYRVRIEEN